LCGRTLTVASSLESSARTESSSKCRETEDEDEICSSALAWFLRSLN
jgi:hypothetical protein